MRNNQEQEQKSAALEEIMRLEIKVTPKVVDAIYDLAVQHRIPVGRMAGMLLAKALKLSEADALPPFKPAGRPRRKQPA